MTELAEMLRKRLRAVPHTRWIVLLGIAGMLLILLSGLLPDKKPPPQTVSTAEGTPAAEQEAYRAALESRLTALLSQMDGAGAVTVMVTLSGSAEQVYAEEVKVSRSENSAQTESAPVLSRVSGDESALISETKSPPVQGAVILCTGGDHAAVRERITNAVSALLGIPAAQIYVGKAAANTERSSLL